MVFPTSLCSPLAPRPAGPRRRAAAVLCALLLLPASPAWAQADAPVRAAQGTLLPIDGTWRILGDGRRVRIHNGRSFDGRTGQPLAREIRETGRGSYALFDLNCECEATMSVTAKGTLMGVANSATGAVPFEMEPIRLQDRAWFDELLEDRG